MMSNNSRTITSLLAAVMMLVLDVSCVNAWVTPRPTISLTQQWHEQQSSTSLHSSAASTSIAQTEEAGDDDDDEYEYVEYELLSEAEFTGSEWLVGTVMDKSSNRIDETWCRLAIDKDGKNIAIWGDNSEGSWNFDVASQFLSMSKEALWGKDIWAGVVDDYYYLQGTVRGWSFLSAAEVVGQWQARRLGVEPDEAPTAPWFETNNEEETGEEAPKLEAATSSEGDSPDTEASTSDAA